MAGKCEKQDQSMNIEHKHTYGYTLGYWWVWMYEVKLAIYINNGIIKVVLSQWWLGMKNNEKIPSYNRHNNTDILI